MLFSFSLSLSVSLLLLVSYLDNQLLSTRHHLHLSLKLRVGVLSFLLSDLFLFRQSGLNDFPSLRQLLQSQLQLLVFLSLFLDLFHHRHLRYDLLHFAVFFLQSELLDRLRGGSERLFLQLFSIENVLLGVFSIQLLLFRVLPVNLNVDILSGQNCR